MAQFATSAALAAWLLLLLWMHAWDRELVGDDWALQRPTVWVALALSAVAVAAELSLLRDRGESWAWLLGILSIPVGALCIAERHPLVATGVVLITTGVPLLVYATPLARVRIAAHLLGAGLSVTAWAEGHIGFGGAAGGPPWPVRAARSMVEYHGVISVGSLVGALAFAAALRRRASRELGAMGLVICGSAGALELLSTAACTQVRDGVLGQPVNWRLDELAAAASVVEYLLVCALVGGLVLAVNDVARRKRRLNTRGAASALTVLGLIVLAAQTPTRAIVPAHESPVPLAHGPVWDQWYQWYPHDERPRVTQIVRVTREGEARLYYGGESIAGFHFDPRARVKVFPHRDAPAWAVEQTVRQLLSQVPELAIAVAASRGVPPLEVPGVAARVRFIPAAGLNPGYDFQRALRPSAGRIGIHERPESRAPCPPPSDGESAERWLSRKPPSCVLEPIESGVTSAAPLAPIGELPGRFPRREPHRPEPLFAAALLGLALGLLVAHRRIQRDLEPLRGPRGPRRGPRRNAPTQPRWLWRRDSTHWWLRGATPYRDIGGFHGPASRDVAMRLLARRWAAVLWGVVKAGVAWCVLLTMLAAAIWLRWHRH